MRSLDKDMKKNFYKGLFLMFLATVGSNLLFASPPPETEYDPEKPWLLRHMNNFDYGVLSVDEILKSREFVVFNFPQNKCDNTILVGELKKGLENQLSNANFFHWMNGFLRYGPHDNWKFITGMYPESKKDAYNGFLYELYLCDRVHSRISKALENSNDERNNKLIGAMADFLRSHFLKRMRIKEDESAKIDKALRNEVVWEADLKLDDFPMGEFFTLDDPASMTDFAAFLRRRFIAIKRSSNDFKQVKKLLEKKDAADLTKDKLSRNENLAKLIELSEKAEKYIEKGWIPTRRTMAQI